MDGTLIGDNGKIAKENIEAIKLAKEKGIKFVIATGRSYEDVKPFLDKNSLVCDCIVSNGAEYRNENGEVLESIYIDKTRTSKVLEVISKYNLSVEMYTDHGYYTTNTREEMISGLIKRSEITHPKLKTYDEKHRHAINHPHFIKMNYITDLHEFLKSNVKISKFISFGDSQKEINVVKEQLRKIQGLAISSSFLTNVEVNDFNATKGKILTKAAEKMNIKSDEVAVFGDGSNDYSMFLEFKNSFAMGNSIDKIKNAAKYITASNIENGVAKGIYKILSDKNMTKR